MSAACLKLTQATPPFGPLDSKHSGRVASKGKIDEGNVRELCRGLNGLLWDFVPVSVKWDLEPSCIANSRSQQSVDKVGRQCSIRPRV